MDKTETFTTSKQHPKKQESMLHTEEKKGEESLRGTDKEGVVHIHNGILFCHKYNETVPFVATWLQLAIITLEKSVRQRKINAI